MLIHTESGTLAKMHFPLLFLINLWKVIFQPLFNHVSSGHRSGCSCRTVWPAGPPQQLFITSCRDSAFIFLSTRVPPVDFLDSCRANTLLAELDDEEDLPEPDDDDDENEDDNQEDQEYEEVLVRKSAACDTDRLISL